MAWVVLIGCQPRAASAPEPACALPPGPGEALVAPLSCEGEVPTGGEGRLGLDVLLSSDTWRAVIRHPLDALTIEGLGGGTVVDLALFGGTDVAHEIVPMVGGGWLRDATLETLADGVRVAGTVAPFPGREARGEGERREVVWRADGRWLVAEGAEGFRLNPAGDELLLGDGGLLQTRSLVWGSDRPAEDEGGVVWVRDTDRLLVATPLDAAAALAEDQGGRRVAGRSVGAEALVLERGGRTLLRVALAGPTFDLQVPASVDAVHAEALGRAPGPSVPPGTDLALAPGGAASVVLRPAWDDGLPRPLRVEHADGRVFVVPASGTRLRLGAGTHDLVLSSGPAFLPRELRLQLQPGMAPDLVVRLEPRFDPGKFVALGFDRPSDRSVGWRGSDLTAALLAASDGLSAAVFGDGRDVAALSSGPFTPSLVAMGSARIEGPGWTASAFPWSATGRVLHGGVGGTGLDPIDAAAAVEGSVDDRSIRVDLGWLDAAGPPWESWPRPTFVALDHPLVTDRAPWYAWLDAAAPLIPTGPVTWLPVDDPALLGQADVEQPLYLGQVCAGNGPIVWLTVDGVPPGGLVRAGDDALHHVVVSALGEPLDHLVLRTEGGQALPGEPGAADVTLEGRWVLVEGWSDDPEGPWAVSGPVWLRAP